MAYNGWLPTIDVYAMFSLYTEERLGTIGKTTDHALAFSPVTRRGPRS
jgi:hypothetical protein